MAGGIYNSAAYLFYSILILYILLTGKSLPHWKCSSLSEKVLINSISLDEYLY
jgi:hypothetical protein